MPFLERARAGLRFLLVFVMVGIGVLHFTAADLFVQIVPRGFPSPYVLVWLSGVMEILLGIALLPTKTRRLAGYGLVALFVAVFPANVYMAVAHVKVHGLPSWLPEPSEAAVWWRLPFQVVFISWALFAANLVFRGKIEGAHG